MHALFAFTQGTCLEWPGTESFPSLNTGVLPPVQMRVQGSKVQFPKLNTSGASVKYQRPVGNLTELLGDGHESVHLRGPVENWLFASKAAELHVLVIGTSVTGGCGSQAPYMTCSAADSWTRRLRHWLLHLLPVPVNVSVYAQNAGTLPYWMHCTQRYFVDQPHVILLELAPSLSLSRNDVNTLNQFITILRELAPHAVVVFIAWPRVGGQLSSEPAKWKTSAEKLHGNMSTFDAQLVSYSAQLEFDLLLVSRLMIRAWSPTWTKRLLMNHFYAEYTHPGPQGHALLAEASGRLIASQIQAQCTLKTPATRKSGTTHQRGDRGSRSDMPPAYHAMSEVCYQSAGELPVVQSQSKGWRLVDDGIAKGVQKLNLLSERVGDCLVLGPILQGSVGARIVHLGFLRSWKPEQGAFNITCSGCRCRGMEDGGTGGGRYSFPVVQTSSTRLPVVNSSKYTQCIDQDCAEDTAHLQCTIGEDGEPDPATCFSITVDTQFLLRKALPMADCLISVCHDTWPRKQPLKTSAVRVAMLSFRGVDVEAEAGLNRSLEVFTRAPP